MLILLFISSLIGLTSAHKWTDQLVLQNISATCYNDTKTWLNSLELFGLVSTECLVSKNCTSQELAILKDNLYAVQQLDAFGKFPVAGILEATVLFDGSYQECQRISDVRYKTNYCYLVIKQQPFPVPLRSAICMPYSCNSQDLVTIFNGSFYDVEAAFCTEYEVEKDTAFWVYTGFLIAIASIVILASFLDYLIPAEKKKTNIFARILGSFCLWENASQILSVKEQKSGFIKSLDCIRGLSMAWVVAGHSVLYFLPPTNLLPLIYIYNNVWHHLIFNAILSVDTFFLISGIVVSYMFFKQKLKLEVMKSPVTWIMFYVHRFLRLTPPVMLFIGFFTVYSVYIQGPAYSSLGNPQIGQADACKTLWWHNLLYFNNFDNQVTGQTCYGITWYLATDFQIYLVAPIFIIAFYISFNIGLIITTLGCLASVITTYVMFSLYDMPADGDFRQNGNDNFFLILYQKPWIRCPPYFIGILVGYILTMRKPRIPWAVAIFGWLTAFGIACACLFINYDYDKGSYWSWPIRATFYNFSRIGWSFSVSWVIYANHFGYGGPVNNFMSHPIWQPFGRLSYCAYIVHWMVLSYYFNLGERPLFYVSFWQIFLYYAIPITLLSFFVAFFGAVFSKLALQNSKKFLSNIGLIFAHEWTENLVLQNISTTCYNDTKTWLNSLELFDFISSECLIMRNCTAEESVVLEEHFYAVQQLDAFAKFPSGILEGILSIDGSYQECQRISNIRYKTNYCYLKIQQEQLPISFKVAVCMPYSCDNQDLITMFNDSFFDVEDTFCSEFEVEKDTTFWVYTGFLIAIASIVILASILDYLIPAGKKKTNIFARILGAFCLWENASQILSVKEQKSGFIKSLDCIRGLSMAWVVAGHSVLFFFPSANRIPLLYVYDNIWNHMIFNAILSVDTFFLISGIVVSYMFFKQKLKLEVMKSPVTWIMFYVHRFLRLTPPVMLFIGFYTVYSVYIQGPYEASIENLQIAQSEMCKQFWWHNLLYFNNFDNPIIGQTCYGITWYLATDFQIYLVAPIFIIAFYISFNIGLIVTTLGCLASVITAYILFSINNMTADINFQHGGIDNFFLIMYQKPWIRCPPYFIGIIVGYILTMKKPRIPWAVAIFGWLTAFGIACACLFINYDYDKGSYWSWPIRATFYNFSRIGWSFSVSWVIYANHFGYGGPVNNFMSHPIWQPFGRLSYCAYIVHWMVLSYYFNLGERPLFYVSFWQIFLYYAIPVTFISFFVAFFWSCIFEVSTAKLEKMLFDSILGDNQKPKPESVVEDTNKTWE
ncbi:unnamed protein product [Caenorhabditis angaria]|uniref:Nose resistant-to-fluoxetine protein N-terminal domain-containing protein n=1 Tax=Caenorhabditis angaria TaxID=860376 RepID=A0A9P1IP03_9PELO|nr:unnamed protein product [Caenorhabditis angaria]